MMKMMTWPTDVLKSHLDIWTNVYLLEIWIESCVQMYLSSLDLALKLNEVPPFVWNFKCCLVQNKLMRVPCEKISKLMFQAFALHQGKLRDCLLLWKWCWKKNYLYLKNGCITFQTPEPSSHSMTICCLSLHQGNT